MRLHDILQGGGGGGSGHETRTDLGIGMPEGAQYRRFQVGCPKNSECKTAKVLRDLNPPIESKLSRDNLDSIGGFYSIGAFRVWTEQAT